MATTLWFIVPILTGLASAAVVYYIMKARMESAIASERAALSEVRGMLEAQKKTMEETVRAAEESSKRKALDEFLADMRVEERHYVREHKLLFMSRKSLVMQERMYFRNIPLSNWVEHEVLMDEGTDIEKLAKSLSIFDEAGIPRLEDVKRPKRLLR